MLLTELIFTALTMLIGEEGKDWEHYALELRLLNRIN